MKPEFNNLQSDWLNQAEELNDNEAAQVNGGTADISANESINRANSLYDAVQERALAFEASTYAAKTDKDKAKSVSA